MLLHRGKPRTLLPIRTRTPHSLVLLLDPMAQRNMTAVAATGGFSRLHLPGPQAASTDGTPCRLQYPGGTLPYCCRGIRYVGAI